MNLAAKVIGDVDNMTKMNAKKTEKTEMPPKKVVTKDSKFANGDETYRQVNLSSFTKNFKVLIGHYKDNTQGSRFN